MKEKVYRKGDVFLADLGIPHGSEQGGRRPVVIVQNDYGLFYAPTVTMVPMTTILKKQHLKTHDALNVNRGEQGYCPALHCRIPFLSGGLFEPIDGYDWEHNDFAIPNEVFSNKKDKREGNGSMYIDESLYKIDSEGNVVVAEIKTPYLIQFKRA